ncbi:MAG: TetR/AcrR family transcriptional regulator [Ferruginibacter sp.]
METLVTQKVFLVLCLIMTEVREANERIHKKAHELFMQYGLRSVSMDDIANNLGMSKKTIYQYYADKDALVDEVVSAIIGQNQLVCEFDRKKAENAIHEVFLAMDMVMEMFLSMNPSLLFEMQKYYPTAHGKFLKHKNDYLYRVIKENIVRGIKEELYRPEIKIDLMARYRVESILLPFHPDFHTKVKSNLAEIEQELTYHFLFGLISQKGHKLILKYQQERLKKILADASK